MSWIDDYFDAGWGEAYSDDDYTNDDYDVYDIEVDPGTEVSYEAQSERAALNAEWTSSTITTDTDLLKVLRSNGIYRRSDMELFTAFHRFPRLDPYNMVTTTREYLFFVKPDLNIFKASGSLSDCISNIAFFSDLQSRGYQRVLEQLQFSINSAYPFMNLLSNRKTSNIDLPNVSADTSETNANMYGTKLNYRKGSESSDENVEFSVEFEDTKFLEVYTLFKAYDEYEKRKWYGEVAPPDDNYVLYKVMHDKMSAFRFVVSEDGETILHWTQFWGILPTSVPRDALSDIPQEGHLKFTVNFKADFVADMDPVSLTDFNHLAKAIPCTNGYIPIWDADNNMVSGENVKKPYVEWPNSGNGSSTYGMYKLRWGGDNVG